MHKLMRIAMPVVACAALAVLSAVPAQAATSGGTGTTFTITGGALSITVPGTADLGSQPAGLTALTATGSLGDVTVSDLRGLLTTWTTTAQSTNFTSGSASVPASSVNYVPGTPNIAGSLTFTQLPATGLDTPKTVATGATIGASNASWNPTISVLLPVGTTVGTYTATITHSVV